MMRQYRQLSSQRLLLLATILPRVIAIAGVLLTSNILSSPRSIYAAGIGSPICRLTILNANSSSLQNLARRYQLTFNAVCPTLVKRFALRPNIVNNFTVTFQPNSGQEGSNAGNQISINANEPLANPYGAVGAFLFYLSFAIQNDSPDETASWFPMSMAFYISGVYGPKDADWAIPLVQPTDSLSGETGAGFLLWLQQHTVPTIVDQLNRAIQTKQSFPTIFQRLTGGTVDDLWNKYKDNPDIAPFRSFLTLNTLADSSIPCVMATHDSDPSLQSTIQLYQRIFKEVCPLIVKRFGHRADVANNFALEFKSNTPGAAAYSDGHALVFNTGWIKSKPSNSRGVFIHEFTHHVQNYSGGAPGWFVEGMATYSDSVYSPVGEPPAFPDSAGNSYKDGYGTAARFLHWLEQHTVPDIVDQLNRAIQNGPFFSCTFQH